MKVVYIVSGFEKDARAGLIWPRLDIIYMLGGADFQIG